MAGRAVSPAIALLALAFTAAAQQETVGPAECVRCHSHARQADQWQTREPASLGPRAHANSLERLKSAEASAIAGRAGLASPRDPRCLKCHATLVRGRARAGVSCESCHGPASAYLEPHQKPDSSALARKAGLADLRVKPEAIARTCVSCHVTLDADLRAAGHPAGEDFDAGRSLPKLEHWTWDVRRTSIDYGLVSRASRTLVAQALANAPPPAAPARAAAPPGAPPGAPTRAAGFDPAAAEPLPDDYREALQAPPPRPAPPSLPGPGPEAPARSPRRASSAAAELVRLRFQLFDLLRQQGRAAGAWPSGLQREYAGPDGELLRLQDEVLALAATTLAGGANGR